MKLSKSLPHCSRSTWPSGCLEHRATPELPGSTCIDPGWLALVSPFLPLGSRSRKRSVSWDCTLDRKATAFSMISWSGNYQCKQWEPLSTRTQWTNKRGRWNNLRQAPDCYRWPRQGHTICFYLNHVAWFPLPQPAVSASQLRSSWFPLIGQTRAH